MSLSVFPLTESSDHFGRLIALHWTWASLFPEFNSIFHPCHEIVCHQCHYAVQYSVTWWWDEDRIGASGPLSADVRVIGSVFPWFLFLSRMGSQREIFTASGDEWTSGFKYSLCKMGKYPLIIRYQWDSHNWWIVSCSWVWPFLETKISLLCDAITANALAICLVP